MPQPQRYLIIELAMREYGRRVSNATIRKWIGYGVPHGCTLKATRRSNEWVCTQDEWDDWLTRRQQAEIDRAKDAYKPLNQQLIEAGLLNETALQSA